MGSFSARLGGKNLPASSKWRGKVTFWNDLEATYFRKLDTGQISSIVDSLRGKDEAALNH